MSINDIGLVILSIIIGFKLIKWIFTINEKDWAEYQEWYYAKFNKVENNLDDEIKEFDRNNYYKILESIKEGYPGYEIIIKNIFNLYTIKYFKHSCIKDLKISINDENNYNQVLITPLSILNYDGILISVCEKCKNVYVLTDKNYL